MKEHTIERCSHCKGSGREPTPVEPPYINRLPPGDLINLGDGRILDLMTWDPEPGSFSAHVRIGRKPSPVSGDDPPSRINRAIAVPPEQIDLGDGRTMRFSDWQVSVMPQQFIEVSGDFFMAETKDD